MAKSEPTRRGKPEKRTHFERARDGFKKARGHRRVVERLDQDPGCPTCALKAQEGKGKPSPMLLRRSYAGVENYKFEGICLSGDESHHILRYGYFSTDTKAPAAVQLDEGA